MATIYTSRSDIEDRLNELEHQKVTLYAPIFAPGAELGLFGKLMRADNGRWRVILGFDQQAMALLFPVQAIERIAYPSADDNMNHPQIQLRTMPQPRSSYEEFT